VLIRVEHVHPSRACLVGDLRDGARERRVLDVAPDVAVLAGAEIETDAYAELRVTADEIL
jgi:hypothetical protein